MSILVANDSYDFVDLKTSLGLTDGNLASNMKALEKETYVEVQKPFKGRKPLTSYIATSLGKVAFEKHLSALEELIRAQKGN